ncbi:ABZJ_00895 family protein [Rhodobacter sp. Har01]|uniref:ABZJ_00895 family protein n=1 Tax=Rhodobacter sp. Har01 TaxID=2883999 RepID=UPI001D092D6B|nr:ABZJ_00895 family protein [Rhodobacter sp. Har01]MCB6178959.1 ABZJ_00895 family protein [Rhodobacter sp. Har01]
MRDRAERRGMGGSLAVFGLALVAGGAAAVALAWAVPALPLPGGLAIVVLLAAALLAGRGFARRAGRPPTGTETASFAMAAMVVAVLAAVAAVWGLLAWQGKAMTDGDFAAVFLRLQASPEVLRRWPLFWAELAPWLALALVWTGFRQGVRWGMPGPADRAEVTAR